MVLHRLMTIGEACRAMLKETLRTTLSWAIEQVTRWEQPYEHVVAQLGLNPDFGKHQFPQRMNHLTKRPVWIMRLGFLLTRQSRNQKGLQRTPRTLRDSQLLM